MHLRSAAGRALSKTARNSYEQPGSLLISETHADRKPRESEADNRYLADILLQKTAKTARAGVVHPKNETRKIGDSFSRPMSPGRTGLKIGGSRHVEAGRRKPRSRADQGSFSELKLRAAPRKPSMTPRSGRQPCRSVGKRRSWPRASAPAHRRPERRICDPPRPRWPPSAIAQSPESFAAPGTDRRKPAPSSRRYARPYASPCPRYPVGRCPAAGAQGSPSTASA